MMPGKVMRGPRVLAIDQVTTRTKAVMVDGAGQVIARASAPLTTGYPHPGRAEQSAGAIWASVQVVIADIMAQAGLPDATAIANQRETMVIWDAETGLPLCPARIWQCRRTDPLYAALIAEGHNPAAVAATGLDINPLFPASTLAWVLREVPAAQAALALGRVRAGTVDCWLLWNLTGGGRLCLRPFQRLAHATVRHLVASWQTPRLPARRAGSASRFRFASRAIAGCRPHRTLCQNGYARRWSPANRQEMAHRPNRPPGSDARSCSKARVLPPDETAPPQACARPDPRPASSSPARPDRTPPRPD